MRGWFRRVPRTAQDGTNLMVVWMSREALDMTAREGKASLLVEVKTQAVAQGRGIRA
jgi:phosphoribosyl-AMP cyclohydrolase